MGERRIPLWFWLGGIGAVGLIALAVLGRKRLPAAFALARNAYAGVAEWASDRGQQIRLAFGISVDTLKPEGATAPKGIGTDDWNARKLKTLNASWRPKFKSFLADAQRIAHSHGAEFIIWDAVRSLERQLSLYKQGRVDGDKVVTKTMASRHLFGLAIDLVLRGASGGPDFSEPPPWYVLEVLPLAAKHGLQSLYLAKGLDKPHIEAKLDEIPVVASATAQIAADFPGLA